MKILYFFIIFPILININCQLLPPLPALNLSFLDQSLALIFPIIQNFKNTITLDPFGVTQSWTGPDICNYKGFYCDNPPNNSSATSLASIDFNGFQLSAPTLDGFIDQLPDLAIFHANSNNFSGTISSEISNLPYLYELDLSNNQFIGTFPMSILNIHTLTFLDIRYNLLTGIIPPQIFVQNLDAFFLNNNNFIQKLPDNLGSTTAFYLTLANNKFVGPIPRSIGQAPNLLEILLLNNLLNGCIPYELGLLKKAIVIDVGYNMLTGPLPCSLGCLESVEQLNFAGNLLYGQATIITTPLNEFVFSKAIQRNKHLGIEIDIRLIKFPAPKNDLPEDSERPAAAMMKEPLEQLIEECRPNCLITDMFLPWTTDSAARFNIPRIVFHGTSYFAQCVGASIKRNKPFNNVSSDSETFLVADLPHEIKLTRTQLSLFEQSGRRVDCYPLFHQSSDP
ncbi:Scopoletin glucosyltransferase [Capsicum annuum]|uniref:Scopoletin glucosyltransferase n=1 Tax=Capsicum annuum TaxID=4072 RepID=A0A2G2XYT4_CAPAN|nr:Scopoletin glucosyltransferase [Capsicum annuum]